ncbi:Fic family protein [Jiangella rhizosphaerae]|uniref:Fic family protein n=1 Tax=Jiangella rhizosphaerae TaxID=2293569 RepID=A0A418KQH8_9ACTN|nr:Fic family protein [Jiangella rhizosphaerae]RIQ21855.1 Fic family protein [Jiangella rhizosphaerae]
MRPPEKLTPALQELLENVDAERDEFLSLGDFGEQVNERLRRAFLPDMISDTLNIEGVHVNPRITLAVLDGLALAEADKYVEVEVRNVIDAHSLVDTLVREGYSLTPDLIRQVNFQIEKEIIPSAGSFRSKDVQISGAQIKPPAFAYVEARVQEICDSFSAYDHHHPVVLAAWIHRELAEVHPFEDGNGRTARLIQDLVLASARFLPVGIPAFRRQEYYDALQTADFGDLEPLIAMIANSQLTALTKARRVAKDPGVRKAAISRLLQGRNQAATRAREREYELWRRRVEELVEETQVWAAELEREVEGARLMRVKLWDPLPLDAWQEIRDRGFIRNSWIATIFISEPASPGFSILLAAKRIDKITTLDLRDRYSEVALQVVVADGENRYDFHYADPYVTVRAICPSEGGFEVLASVPGPAGASKRVTATEAVEALLTGAALKAGWSS